MSVSLIGILYCIDALPSGGGTENQLAGLIRRLDRRRFDVHLCTLRGTANPPDLPDCARLELDLPGWLHPRAWREIDRLARYLRERRIDVVQSFFQDATLAAALAGSRAGTPVRLAAFRDLGFWRNRRSEFLMRRAYPRLTGFVANSQAVKAHFCARDRLPPGRVAVIPNGVDPDEFTFVDHAGPDAPAVGIVGNLNRAVKRTDLFIAAAGRLAPAHPGVVWHVVGDGALRPRLAEQARALGLGDRIVFAGRVDPVGDYLGRLAVGVICSDSEGFSNSVLEYMLRGCAVVATDVGGNREAVRHGETGLLVRPGDAEALAAAIGRLLDDPGARRALARRARAEAQQRFGWEACVAAHEDLYGRALAAAGGTH